VPVTRVKHSQECVSRKTGQSLPRVTESSGHDLADLSYVAVRAISSVTAVASEIAALVPDSPLQSHFIPERNSAADNRPKLNAGHAGNHH